MKGWSYPSARARKACYFDFDKGPRSLCGKWLMLSTDPARVHDDKHESPDNCAVCKRQARHGGAVSLPVCPECGEPVALPCLVTYDEPVSAENPTGRCIGRCPHPCHGRAQEVVEAVGRWSEAGRGGDVDATVACAIALSDAYDALVASLTPRAEEAPDAR